MFRIVKACGLAGAQLKPGAVSSSWVTEMWAPLVTPPAYSTPRNVEEFLASKVPVVYSSVETVEGMVKLFAGVMVPPPDEITVSCTFAALAALLTTAPGRLMLPVATIVTSPVSHSESCFANDTSPVT